MGTPNSVKTDVPHQIVLRYLIFEKVTEYDGAGIIFSLYCGQHNFQFQTSN